MPDVLRKYDVGFNWSGDAVTFVDEAANGHVKRLSSSMGRNEELSQVEGARATIILENDSGRFTPEYAAGPLFGKLETERRVRVRGYRSDGVTTDPLFYGFLWEIAPDILSKKVTVICRDWSMLLEEFHLNLGPLENKTTGLIIGAILDEAGFPSGGKQVLTVSGNEITDVSRALGVEGDGLSGDSSYGIYDAATNLVLNGGFATDATGWATAGTNTIARSSEQKKFGTHSLKCTYGDTASLLAENALITLTAAAHSPSIWVYIPTAYDGTDLRFTQINYVGATGDSFVSADMSKRDQWQRLTLTFSPVVGDLIGNVRIKEGGSPPTPGRFIYIDGCQQELGLDATPYIETDGATATRSKARVQFPVAGVLDETQGWAALRFRSGFTSADLATGKPLFTWMDDGSNRIIMWMETGSAVFVYRNAGGAGSPTSAALSLTPGDIATVIIAWTASEVKISVNGGVFASVANSSIPVLAATLADIGQGNTAEVMDSDALWAAFGAGTLTDADAAAINALGNTDPTFASLPEIPTLIWPADTATASPTWRDLDAGQTTLPLWHARNTDAWTALKEVVDHELGGILYFDQSGRAIFEDRHVRAKSSVVNTHTNTLGNLVYRRRDKQVYAKAILTGGGFEEGIPGSQIWSYSPLPVQLAAGEELESRNINYSQAAKDVITPVSATDYAATANADGTGGDRTSDLSVTTFNNFGGGAEFVIKNTGSTALWVQKKQIRGTPVGLPLGARTIQRTGTALGALTKTFRKTYPFIEDLDVLRGFAEYIVNHYAVPRPLLQAQQEAEDEATKAKLFSSRLSDRQTITDTIQPWHTNVTGDFFIEKLTHDIEIGFGVHRTGWSLTDFSADAFWIWGSSKWGEDTVWGY